ncbi:MULTISPECIES: NUDIX hydrolase [Reichenbachiella]|uniref:NUDIX hydrolase n=1 Tax=Reichenbachiella TaxID=156993 RepID=UPI000E6D1B70|nr:MULTISPECIES: NUDIX domain-containing protein [Reichenbachiella]MBU2912957.1 NUDIX domain-containing protein [Reichenbachiella agariperforans]RJE72829.1 DNA mismatch repair protein MutT [Reichenbachiella sp. MSK19-1]
MNEIKGINLAKHNETYQDGTPILVAVDNVIFGFDPVEEKLKVLLFKRQVEPQAGNWSLIGSFVQSDESAELASQRILTKFTGLTDVFLEHFNTYSDIDRDPGARVISLGYYSLIRIDEQKEELVQSFHAQWFHIDEIPDLVIDHNQMILDALHTLQNESRRKPIGFNLLPEKFTIPKLLKLYQEILQAPLDDRNFRKKILSAGYLDRLDSKDKSTSKKGAYYYQFNIEAYFDLVKKGYSLVLP